MARRKTARPKITSVSFRANTPVSSNSKYEHIHVEATAAVGPGESPEKVLDGLKEFVATELRIAKEGERPQPVDARRRFRV